MGTAILATLIADGTFIPSVGVRQVVDNPHETPLHFGNKAFDRLASVEKPLPQRLCVSFRQDSFVKDQVLLPQGPPLGEVGIDRIANDDLRHF